MTLADLHDFELRLLDPCLAMSEKGLRVDEPRRLAMIADLEALRAPLIESLQRLVLSQMALAKLNGVDLRLSKPHLFSEKWTCKTCRNGSKKRLTCTACGGDGQRITATFNPASDEQTKIVLYELFRLLPRTTAGKLRSDEDALKDLLGVIKDRPKPTVPDPVVREFIESLLTLTKATTMQGILERIAPAPDGRIRTFYNPAGTETGRFSSSESFLIASTNMQNLPKREVSDARFDVRRCIVPDAGCVFVEADLSGAEAWVTAACCGDTDLLVKLRTSGFDVHRWTAAHIFGKPIDCVDGRDRQLGKVARHALNYGMQWLTFQRNVNAEADKTGVSIDAKLAKHICAEYHRLHPKLAVWWGSVAIELGRVKSLTTCFGRRRHFFGRDATHHLSETHREAIAYEPQSTVADLLNRGLLRWWDRYEGRQGTLLAQIHDAVLIQCPAQRAGLASQMLRRCLTEAIVVHGVELTIPVDVTVSEHWGTWKEAA